jgi:hypothetical protein
MRYRHWASETSIEHGCVWEATIDWGDGTPIQSVIAHAAKAFVLLAKHTYATRAEENITLGGHRVSTDGWL